MLNALLVVSWLLAPASLASAILSSQAVKRAQQQQYDAIMALTHCSGCGGQHAGFIHEPGCPRSDPTVSR